jgi:hypothetical protein
LCLQFDCLEHLHGVVNFHRQDIVVLGPFNRPKDAQCPHRAPEAVLENRDDQIPILHGRREAFGKGSIVARIEKNETPDVASGFRHFFPTKAVRVFKPL